MAATNIITHVSSLRLRFSNQRWPLWPNPEQSIDPAASSILIGDKQYWPAQGPARAAFDSIKDDIRKELEQRFNELYDGIREVPVPNSYDCYMVGRERSKACPFVVISCLPKVIGLRIINIVRTSTWWDSFIQKNQGFGRFSHVPCFSRRLGHQTLDEYVWASPDLDETFYNLPISMRAGSTHPGDAQSTQTATMGGILFIDDKPYGLTVAHVFTEPSRRTSLVPESSSTEAYYEDSIDDDSGFETTDEFERLSDIRTDIPISTQGLHSDLLYVRPNRKFDWTHMLYSSVPIGRVFDRSDGGPHDDIDWALVELQKLYEELSKIQSPDSRRSSIRSIGGNFNISELPRPKFIAGQSQKAKSVYVSSSQGRLAHGIFNEYQTFICLEGGREYVSLSTITMSETLVSGDCGKWVFDEEGYWYGHVVAGNPLLKTVYITPATKLVQSIRNAKPFSSVRLMRLEHIIQDLYTAVDQGEVSKVQNLLHQIKDSSTISSPHETAFEAGISHREIVELLIPRVDININYGEPLSWAVRTGCTDIVGRLLNRPDIDVNLGEPISDAARAGHKDIVDLLLTHPNIDVNVNKGRPLLQAVYAGHKDVVDLLLAHPDTDVNLRQPLSKAAWAGHKDVVELLLARSDIDVNLGQPLSESAYAGHEDVVELLLTHSDIDVNLGQPLSIAVYAGRKDIVKLLLTHPGITVNLGVLLSTAKSAGHKEIVDLLLAWSSKRDHPDENESSVTKYGRSTDNLRPTRGGKGPGTDY